MSESEIIKVYQEGIQSVISLVQGLSTQISELSQTVSDLDAQSLEALSSVNQKLDVESFFEVQRFLNNTHTLGKFADDV